MDLQAIGNFISTIGFPIFVACFVLYKSSKDTETLADTVNELKVAITELTALIKNK